MCSLQGANRIRVRDLVWRLRIGHVESIIKKHLWFFAMMSVVFLAQILWFIINALLFTRTLRPAFGLDAVVQMFGTVMTFAYAWYLLQAARSGGAYVNVLRDKRLGTDLDVSVTRPHEDVSDGNVEKRIIFWQAELNKRVSLPMLLFTAANHRLAITAWALYAAALAVASAAESFALLNFTQVMWAFPLLSMLLLFTMYSGAVFCVVRSRSFVRRSLNESICPSCKRDLSSLDKGVSSCPNCSLEKPLVPPPILT